MNVVIKVNDEIKKKMIEYYKDKVRDKKIPYVVFQAQEEDTVITMYEHCRSKLWHNQILVLG